MRTTFTLLALLLLSGIAPASAQEAGPQRVRREPGSPAPAQPLPNTPLDDAQRAAVVEEIARQLEASYVFPDVGRRYAGRLRQQLGAGAYGRLTDARAFADTLTRALQRVAPDRHLVVMSPEVARARFGAARFQPGAGQGPGAFQATLSAQERPRNHYFRAVEVLPGNVGYLALDQFPGAEEARATLAAALNFLAHTDALILDLRQNPGGIEGMNRLLASHFFAPDTSVVLYSRYNRETDATATYRVLADVPGPRRPDVPLYVLVSGRTGSAAENLAYALGTRGRATVVGETTAGAANTSRPVVLPHGFAFVLPFARVINPITGTNWEGTGVAPTLAVSAAQARDAAHAHALRLLLAQAPDEAARTALQQALAGVEAPTPSATAARANAPGNAEVRPDSEPVTVAPEVLARYAGRYGERTLRLENGALVFQRDGGGALRLVSLSDTLFRFENDPAARLAVVLDAAGAPTSIRVTPPGGAPILAPRTGN